MKRTFKSKLVVFLLIAFMFLSPICLAVEPRVALENDTEDETNGNGTYEFIASDVYEFDEDVLIDTIVDGNAFAFGNNINVTGEIGGDLFAFGGTVTVSENAYVHGSIFVFAKDFVMNGACYDIYGAGETVKIGKSAIVARDIRIGADKISIGGEIKRNAFVTTNELTFPETAQTLIAGNLEYTSSSEFMINEGIVAGNVKYIPEVVEEDTMAEKVTSFITDTISTLLYTLVIVLLTIWLAPNFKNNIGTTLKKKAPVSLGVGLLATIIIPIVAFVLLIFTGGVAINIALAAVAIYILVLTICQTIFGMGLAKLIGEKMNKDSLPVFIGMSLLVVLVIRLIDFIPYVGGIITFFTAMIGFGLLLVSLVSKRKNASTNEAVPVSEVKSEETK